MGDGKGGGVHMNLHVQVVLLKCGGFVGVCGVHPIPLLAWEEKKEQQWVGV